MTDRPVIALRHDPPRRHPGREHHALAGRQAPRRADARRVRLPVHRGRLAGLQPQGHRVLRGRPQASAGRRRSWPPSGRPATRTTRPSDDPNLRELVAAETPVVTIFGKSWLLHVTEVLGATPQQNLDMVADSVAVRRRARPRGGLRRRALLRRLPRRSRLRALDPARRAPGRRPDAGPVRHQRRDADRRARPDPRRRPRLARGRPRRAGRRPGASTPTTTRSSRSRTRSPRSRPGVRHVQATINGYGERCGNANMVSILANLALKTELGLTPAGGGDLVGAHRALAVGRRDRQPEPERLPAVRRPVGVRPQGRGPRRRGREGRAELPARRPGGRRQRRAGSWCRELGGRANTAIRAAPAGPRAGGGPGPARALEPDQAAGARGPRVRGRRGVVRAADPAQLPGYAAPFRIVDYTVPRGAAGRPGAPRRGHGQGRGRGRGPPHGRRRQRPGQRARRRAAQGARGVLPGARRRSTSSTTRCASWTGRPPRRPGPASSSTRRTARRPGARWAATRTSSRRPRRRSLTRSSTRSGRTARRSSGATSATSPRADRARRRGRRHGGGVVSGAPIRLDRWTVTSGSQRRQPRRGRPPRRRPRLEGVGRGQRARSTRCSGRSTGRWPTVDRRRPAAARLRRPRAGRGSRGGGQGHGADRAAGATPSGGRGDGLFDAAASPEHDRRLRRGVRGGAQRDARHGRVGRGGRGGGADRTGRRACPGRGRGVVGHGVRRGGPVHRHDRVVQPLGGGGEPEEGSARRHRRRRLQPVRGGRLGGAGRVVRVPVADDAPGRRAPCSARRRSVPGARCWTWAPGRATWPRPRRRSGRTPWAWTSRPSMVRRAAITHPSIPFRVGSFEAIPAGAGAFDAVVGNFVFNHVGRPELALAEARRVLRPGGWLALSTWDAPRHNRLLGTHARRRSRGRRAAAARAARRARPTSGPTTELRELFERAGFARGRRLAPPVRGAGRVAGRAVGGGPRLRGPDPAARSTQQAAEVQARIRVGFDRLVEAHRRADGTLGDPGRGPGHPGPPSVTAILGCASGTRASPGPSRRRRCCGSSPRRRPCRRPRSVPCSRGPRRVARRRASCRSSRRCSGRSGRTSTCCGSSTCRSSARSASRCGWRSSRCPGSASRPIERVYSISAALAQADDVPPVAPVDGRRRRTTPRAPRARSPSAASAGAAAVASARVAAIYGLEVLADDIQSGSDNHTRFAVLAPAAAMRRAVIARGRARGRRRAAADVAGVRGPERARVAVPVARRVRHARAQPVAAGVAAVGGARGALGVPVLGRPRRATRRTRPAPRRSRRSARRPRWSGSWAPTRGRPRTDCRSTPRQPGRARAGSSRRAGLAARAAPAA